MSERTLLGQLGPQGLTCGQPVGVRSLIAGQALVSDQVGAVASVLPVPDQ